MIEVLVSAALVFGAVVGGLSLLSGVEAAGRRLETRDRVYREAARISGLLRGDLARADSTPSLEPGLATIPIDDPLGPRDDPATTAPTDEGRAPSADSPFDSVRDPFASVQRSGEGDSLYFRTRVDRGDRCVPANVLWRVVFRDENRNGRADAGERRLERIVLPLAASGGLDGAHVERQTLSARLVHFRVTTFDARERRFVDPPGGRRRFGYPADASSLGRLTSDGVLSCDAVDDGFAELRRGDEVWLEPSGIPAGLYPIADRRGGRLLFRLPGRPDPGPVAFRAAWLPMALRATFAIEGDALEADQLLRPVPSDVRGRCDRRAIVRSFAVTVAMRGAL